MFTPNELEPGVHQLPVQSLLKWIKPLYIKYQSRIKSYKSLYINNVLVQILTKRTEPNLTALH